MQRPDYKTKSSSELMNQMISVQVLTNGLNLSPLTTPISRWLVDKAVGVWSTKPIDALFIHIRLTLTYGLAFYYMEETQEWKLLLDLLWYYVHSSHPD